MKRMPNPNKDPIVVPKSSPYCGRIDKHPAHEHHTHGPGPRRPLRCPGSPVTEGGQR